jgi:hypothetical protein
MNPGPNISLFVYVGGVHRHALSIPRVRIHDYALKPYKWLRFLGYIIYGLHGVDGHISAHHDCWSHPMPEEDMERLELDDNDNIYYFSNSMLSTYAKFILTVVSENS